MAHAKVSKLVFHTTVTPRWLEKRVRFWYAYQAREVCRFYIVDPVKKAEASACSPGDQVVFNGRSVK